jgi:hypothetical protein
VYVHSGNSWHIGCLCSRVGVTEISLSLALLVTRILLVNDVDAAFPADNLVVRTPLLYACPDLHLYLWFVS